MALSFRTRLVKLLNAAVAADSVNSSSIDLSEYVGNLFLIVDARSGGTNNVTPTVAHSDDNSTFTAVPASAIFDVFTGDAYAFTAVGASASSQYAGVNRQQCKRYLRVQLTGTTISGHNFAIVIAAQPQDTLGF